MTSGAAAEQEGYFSGISLGIIVDFFADEIRGPTDQGGQPSNHIIWQRRMKREDFGQPATAFLLPRSFITL